MTAIGEGFKLDQRSKIRCVNTGIEEPEYAGIGATTGVQSYNRPGVGIANGTYAGGTIFTFQFWEDGHTKPLPAAINCQIMHLTCQLLSFIAIKSSFPKPEWTGLKSHEHPWCKRQTQGWVTIAAFLRLVASGGMQLAMILKVIMALNGCRLPNPMAVQSMGWHWVSLIEPLRQDVFLILFGIEENWLILGCDEANISGGSSNNSGMVTPFYKTGDSWTAQNSFVPPDNIPGDRFGTDLAITSNELLVSATGAAGASRKGLLLSLQWAVLGFSWQFFTTGCCSRRQIWKCSCHWQKQGLYFKPIQKCWWYKGW